MPCGLPVATLCPGPERALDTHPHTRPVGEVADRSPASLQLAKGPLQVTSELPRPVLERDVDMSNWCPTCQTTLLRCARVGCGASRDQVWLYAHLAGTIATAKAVREHPLGDADVDALREYTLKESLKIARAYDPDRVGWKPPVASLVTYIQNNATKRATTRAWELRRIAEGIHPIDGNGQVGGRPVGPPSEGPEEKLLRKELFGQAAANWNGLLVLIRARLDGLPNIGDEPTAAPADVLAHLAAGFTRWMSLMTRGEAEEAKRVAAFAASTLSVALGWRANNPTVGRWIWGELMPRLELLRANKDGELNGGQVWLLEVFMRWLRDSRHKKSRASAGKEVRDVER